MSKIIWNEGCRSLNSLALARCFHYLMPESGLKRLLIALEEYLVTLDLSCNMNLKFT